MLGSGTTSTVSALIIGEKLRVLLGMSSISKKGPVKECVTSAPAVLLLPVRAMMSKFIIFVDPLILISNKRVSWGEVPDKSEDVWNTSKNRSCNWYC